MRVYIGQIWSVYYQQPIKKKLKTTCGTHTHVENTQWNVCSLVGYKELYERHPQHAMAIKYSLPLLTHTQAVLEHDN